MKLKIKRHEYKISRDDTFMDNGACIQLLSQSKEPSAWGKRPDPVLSKRAIGEISKFKRIDINHRYGKGVQVFRLDL